MKISRLIKELAEVIVQYGDLRVVITDENDRHKFAEPSVKIHTTKLTCGSIVVDVVEIVEIK